MSHPDPCYDPDNSYEDDDMMNIYDDYDDFYEDTDDSFDDSMDGDTESALASAGHGMDESYGYYGDDGVEDFHADEAVGFVDYNEDGPYDD
jgi:hypothetical protein